MTWCGRPAAARLRTLRRLGCGSMASSSVAWPSPFGLVALAAGKHPFPSRTRPLRLHAVMILRPGARESNASPILISSGPWLPAKPGDFFVSLFPPRLARRRKTPAIGTEVLRAEARDVPTTSLPTSPPLGRKFSARKRGRYRRPPRQPARHWAGSSPRGSAGCTDGVLAVGDGSGRSPRLRRVSGATEFRRAKRGGGRFPPLGRKFSVRERGMYLRRPRRRLWKRA